MTLSHVVSYKQPNSDTWVKQKFRFNNKTKRLDWSYIISQYYKQGHDFPLQLTKWITCVCWLDNSCDFLASDSNQLKKKERIASLLGLNEKDGLIRNFVPKKGSKALFWKTWKVSFSPSIWCCTNLGVSLIFFFLPIKPILSLCLFLCVWLCVCVCIITYIFPLFLLPSLLLFKVSPPSFLDLVLLLSWWLLLRKNLNHV